jgi:hypothetical protein
VFIESVSASSFDPEQLAVALKQIERDKGIFNDAGLSLDGKHLLGVIRPPLTNPAYGLGMAIQEPTGQLRLAYSKSEGDAIKAMLEEKRRTLDKRDPLTPILRDAFVYQETKDTIRDGVCPSA